MHHLCTHARSGGGVARRQLWPWVQDKRHYHHGNLLEVRAADETLSSLHQCLCKALTLSSLPSSSFIAAGILASLVQVKNAASLLFLRCR